MKHILYWLSVFLFIIGCFGASVTICYGAFRVHYICGWFVLFIELIVLGGILHDISEQEEA